jgi:hypothetical protein
VRIENAAFWAKCSMGDSEQYRPVFFTGYGHHEPVKEVRLVTFAAVRSTDRQAVLPLPG